MKPVNSWKVWHAGNASDCLLELCDRDGARHYLHLSEGAAFVLGTLLIEKAKETYEQRQSGEVAP